MKTFAVMAALCGLGVALPATAKTTEVVLRLNERVPFATLAKSVTDPSSPRYQKFYTVDEIRTLVGPTDAEYQTFLANLAKQGLTVVAESPTHLYVTVRGDEQAYSSTMPLALLPNVASVTTHNGRKSRPHYRLQTAEGKYDGVSLEQIRTLFGFDGIYAQGLTGAGQHIAIATYNDFNADEVQTYYQNHNLSPMPTVDKVTFNGAAPADANSAIETEVDAEFSGALAPGAAIHVFTSATNDDAGELAMFTAILDDGRAKIANYSWGGCESDVSAQHHKDMDAVFNRAVAQGVNIMVASGDTGSECKQGAGTTPDWPAAHSAVVAVGGMSLDTSSSTLSATAWNGSGGGISNFYSLPSYESGFQAPYTKRSYPDVAFNADPASGQAAWVSQGGGLIPAGDMVIGGTSIAAPQWSGFLALVGEARAKANKSPVGYLNNTIYAMADSDRATTLYDVTSGSNGAYTAGAGWDAVTGWGSMHAEALLNYLVAH